MHCRNNHDKVDITYKANEVINLINAMICSLFVCTSLYLSSHSKWAQFRRRLHLKREKIFKKINLQLIWKYMREGAWKSNQSRSNREAAVRIYLSRPLFF